MRGTLRLIVRRLRRSSLMLALTMLGRRGNKPAVVDVVEMLFVFVAMKRYNWWKIGFGLIWTVFLCFVLVPYA